MMDDEPVRVYGHGAFGTNSEDASRCIVEVADSTGFHWNQCRRKRGHGPDGRYCKQHAKMKEAGNYLSIGRLVKVRKP